MISKSIKSTKRFIKGVFAAGLLFSATLTANADTIPDSSTLLWRVGANLHPGWVPPSNSFLEGYNRENRRVGSSMAAGVRADIGFNTSSRLGRLYPNLYQGIGVDVYSFFCKDLIGTPVSVYVYQGAPIVHFSRRLWLGYEWQFGVAAGWHHYNREDAYENIALSTSVTAHIGLGLKLHYSINNRLNMSAAIEATHFSNGNTSIPNAGVNTVGASLGIAYTINPQPEPERPSEEMVAEADRPDWIYDIVAYGAWRRRALILESSPAICPGHFGIAGLQIAPMRRFNRWFAAGAALDMQYDESSGLAPYWIAGSYDEYIKFTRPPFGKQLEIGVSAHAELIMPIFAVNVGVGYNLLNPVGEKRFYQSLTLKTFVHRNIFLNVGYRLGNFKDPQNLMLGVGVRL